MKLYSQSQSILISGITGSGKTESTKSIVDFLCDSTDGNISKKILASNPILESFGNARTEGNTNSSRFSKFIKVTWCRISIDQRDFSDFITKASFNYF